MLGAGLPSVGTTDWEQLAMPRAAMQAVTGTETRPPVEEDWEHLAAPKMAAQIETYA